MKKEILSNMLWRFAERCGAQFIQFFVSIILARILAPEAYGTIALIMVFAQILQVFVDSGLGNALIQKKDADDLDFSTVFYFNILWCLVLYGLIYALAPLIARFYSDPSLVPMVRVLCLMVVISGVKNVQQAYVSRNLQFKKFFFATLGGTILSAVVGIAIALNGGGVWALIAQKLVNAAADTLVLWLTVKWRPKWMFSWTRLRSLFSFGWKLLASSLMDTVYQNLRQLIIGRLYTEADLAYYNQGRQFPYLVINNINISIDSVLLPTMSANQNSCESVKSMTRRAIKISSFIMWPMMVGLGVCAEPLVRLVLTEKWLPCVPYLRIFCFSFAFYPIHTSNLNAIKAMGRSDIFLRLEIEKKITGLILLLATMWHGVMVMAYSLLVGTVISSFINAYPNKKLLDYSYPEQIRDILPSILLSVVMGGAVYLVTFLHLSDILTLMVQIPLGVIVYILGAKIMKFESYSYILGIIKRHS